MRINSILLVFSLSFVANISGLQDNPRLSSSRNLLASKNHYHPTHIQIHPNTPHPHPSQVHKNTPHLSPNPKKHQESRVNERNKIIEKNRKNEKKNEKKNENKKVDSKSLYKNTKVKKLILTSQPVRPSQPKYFYDDVFSSFNQLSDFQTIFPPQYFSFASQKFTSNTVLVNIRGKKINPVGFFETGIKNAFSTPGIEFASVDEINPNSFAPKKNGKYNKSILYSNAVNFLKKLKEFSDSPIYKGRINLFVTNVSPRFFSNYPGFAAFIGELLRLSHNNYIGLIFAENYRAPITAAFANVCLSSSNNRQGCIDSLNAPLNSYQWSSTKNNAKSAISNFRSLMKSLCNECDIERTVFPTFGLSNQNGVSLNNCFKTGSDCRDDLIELTDLITQLKDEAHVAFYGAAHVTDTRNLIIQNGNYYDVEALYCEIITAAYPELGTCTESE